MRSPTIALLTALLLPLVYCPSVFAASDDDEDSSDSDSSDRKSKSKASDDDSDKDDDDESPGKTEGADVREDGKESKKELDPGEIERAKAAEVANSPVELKTKTYYFVGLRYRGMLIPRFMMNIFGDGGTGVYSNGLGPEFTVRKDNFEYVLSAWWAGYNMSDTRFKAANDPIQSYEFVRAKLNVLYFTSDFNWTSQISPVFGLNLGVGAGFGIVWGDIRRNEAARVNGTWVNCIGPGNPDPSYCGTGSDEQYKYHEPSWAGGGSKPNVFPWLALQTGMRIKPHRHFMLRIDAGWAITGPFFGVSGNYGI
jgi:hypothetical protein